MILSAMFNSISGLTAATKRVEASSSNIANMRTATGLKDAQAEAALQAQGSGASQASTFKGFKPFRVHQETVEGGGVRTTVLEDDNFFVPVFDPSNPVADPDGMVAMPNVDPAAELVNLKLAKHAYSASLAAIRTQDEMLGALLDDET